MYSCLSDSRKTSLIPVNGWERLLKLKQLRFASLLDDNDHFEHLEHECALENYLDEVDTERCLDGYNWGLVRRSWCVNWDDQSNGGSLQEVRKKKKRKLVFPKFPDVEVYTQSSSNDPQYIDYLSRQLSRTNYAMKSVDVILMAEIVSVSSSATADSESDESK